MPQPPPGHWESAFKDSKGQGVGGGAIVLQASLTPLGLCSETDILPSGGSDWLLHATHTSEGKPREYPPCCPKLCHLTSWNTKDYCCSVAESCLTLQSRGLEHARLPCASLSPRVCSNSCPFSRWCHPTISSSVAPFSFCLHSQHWVFSNELEKYQGFSVGNSHISTWKANLTHLGDSGNIARKCR